MSNEIILINGAQNSLPDTIETLYSAPTNKSILITAFTAANNTESSKSYKAYIYSSSGVALAATVPLTIVVRDKFDLAPSLVGHTIPNGGSLRIESSDADSIIFRATGREI